MRRHLKVVLLLAALLAFIVNEGNFPWWPWGP
ncbi:hypothetical protein AT54_00964 [Streptococcus equi subsp. zooepidemicus Sz12is]|uniref:Phage protein n=2 Tax=Streptococcus equi TaxID=1336 RepID=A0AAW3GJY8_STRSZ|nr:hypothetical protein Q426_09825 [Streptococcus equi subsp. zooepidemicus CY]KIS04527.1 hypothetical protein AT54_00964 [Streptococcus equi subsp. zooepidemicus Sz12is]KIS16000.1 hypothetical protein AT55_01242 [Streptococcus equi subsp. zooepidemicus Sz4is]CRV29707.1 Uncharacterised protein [Streptococcus equi subsp. equi]